MDATSDRESDMLDLTAVRLAHLGQLDDTVLARSLRRLLDEADRPQDAIAGFQSAL
ncbi:FxSxx-COOH cyclophane-containing RiPP peptide [Longispora urticae]